MTPNYLFKKVECKYIIFSEDFENFMDFVDCFCPDNFNRTPIINNIFEINLNRKIN